MSALLRLRPILLALPICVWLIAPVYAAPDAVSAVTVTDEAGRAIPARILVRMTDVPGYELYEQLVEGPAQLTSRDGPAHIAISHGPQFAIEERDVVIAKATGQGLKVALKRLVDLQARGYLAGDNHMHSTFSDGALPPTQVAFACRAEGLRYAFLTDHDTVAGHAEWLAQAREGFLPLPGEEVTSAGHILALGVRTVVLAKGTDAAAAKQVFADIHAQGGTAIVAHPNSPLGGEGYTAWSVTDYDGLEILNGFLPPYGGLFDFLQARMRWRGMLSEGKRIPVIGDSDNHDPLDSIVRAALRDPEAAVKKQPELRVLLNMPDRDKLIIPWGLKGLHVGTFRTCVYAPRADQKVILDAVKAGHSFVTNGPLILATVQGAPPGSQVHGDDFVEVKIEAVANRPLQHIDIVVDNKVAQSIRPTDPEHCTETVHLPATGAKWLLVEAYGPWPEFATTNAWYLN